MINEIINFKAGVCGRLSGNNESNCNGLITFTASNAIG